MKGPPCPLGGIKIYHKSYQQSVPHSSYLVSINPPPPSYSSVWNGSALALVTIFSMLTSHNREMYSFGEQPFGQDVAPVLSNTNLTGVAQALSWPQFIRNCEQLAGAAGKDRGEERGRVLVVEVGKLLRALGGFLCCTTQSASRALQDRPLTGVRDVEIQRTRERREVWGAGSSSRPVVPDCCLCF